MFLFTSQMVPGTLLSTLSFTLQTPPSWLRTSQGERRNPCVVCRVWRWFWSINLFYLSVHSFFFVGPQVLSVSAAERWRGVGPSSLLLCHPHRLGLLHGSVWAGRLRPRGAGQRLHQRAALRPQPDQRTGGEGHGAPQDLQVSHSKTPFHRCNHCGFSVHVLWIILSLASLPLYPKHRYADVNKNEQLLMIKFNVGEHFC